MAVEKLQQSGSRDAFEAHYRDYYELVFALVTRRFRIPDHDAETVVQEVFLAYLAQPADILNVRTWLVTVACNMSRYYWRVQKRTEPLPVDYEEIATSEEAAELYENRLRLEKLLGSVPPQSREILRLHYLEGYSAPEIAARLDTTSGYAEKMIHQALRSVRNASEVKTL